MNVLDSLKLDGKVALVTGGAGLYGRQIVEALAEAGAKTFMASRHLEALRQQAEIFKQAGLDVTALQLDQSSEDSIKQILSKILETAGKVDILVNGERVDALSQLVTREKARPRALHYCERLEEAIPRQQFKIAIQGAIGGDIIARRTISALRKDVTAKCYDAVYSVINIRLQQLPDIFFCRTYASQMRGSINACIFYF